MFKYSGKYVLFYIPFFAVLKISTNAQTPLTIVTTTQPVQILMVHLIVLAVLVTLEMEHLAKVIIFYNRKL